MRKLAILTFQTMDGVMQAPSDPKEDSSGGFSQGGWAREHWEEVMTQVAKEAMAEPYDLLLGHTTYRMFASSFASSDTESPVAQQLNQAKKYVVTSSRESLEWKNSERISGDIVSAISQLKQQDGPLLQVHGSWQLIQLLLAKGLVDELRLWTFPVVVGEGKRLFADGTVSIRFKLTKFEACPSGAFMHFYEPV
ncbi:MAG: dihydrofolate reductase family protein [Kangiellaceae bacterium]|nr:dihydrofolate reductase family protein [Kangiellaceae bacterium]